MESEIVGVTGILVTCSYANQEFFRVGYYVNNYYEELELAENPPEKPLIDRLIRHILVEKPRVTKFQIQWDDQAQSSGGLDAMNQGGMMMMSAQEQQQMETWREQLSSPPSQGRWRV